MLYETWKQFRDNIMRTSFAFNIEYPPEDENKIADFEAQVESKLKDFNKNRNIILYSNNEKQALVALNIKIYSEEFQFVSKIKDDNKYSFFDRCVLYYKIINRSNFLSMEDYNNISNTLKDFYILHPDYSKPYFVNTFPLANLVKIPEDKAPTYCQYYLQTEQNFNLPFRNLTMNDVFQCKMGDSGIACDKVNVSNINSKIPHSPECIVVGGPKYENYSSIGVFCDNETDYYSINKQILHPSENNFIYNNGTSFAITFASKVLDEIMEDSTEKTMISISLHFYYLSYVNIGYYLHIQ